MKPLRSTSFRTFVLYPVLIVAWELLLNDGRLRLQPWFLPLLAWGYLQYRLVGRYRIRRGQHADRSRRPEADHLRNRLPPAGRLVEAVELKVRGQVRFADCHSWSLRRASLAAGSMARSWLSRFAVSSIT